MDLYIFAGANGSGKSTLVDSFFKNALYADVNYICPDSIAEILKSSYPNADIETIYIMAMQKAQDLRYDALEKRIPLCVETVLSTKEKIDFILSAKEIGYKIHIIYVTTKNPSINISRIRKRVSQGGHNVPIDKVRSRYYKSLSFLPELINIANDILIYDNSFAKPMLVYSSDDNFIMSEYCDVKWFAEYVIPYI